MRKKVFLIISIISVLAVSALSFASCGEFNHLRPSGVYSTYEYTDQATGRVHRILVQFIQEDLNEKTGVSGKVNFAHQIKLPNVDKWLTETINKDSKYYVTNPNVDKGDYRTSERINIQSPWGLVSSFGFSSNSFNLGSSETWYEVPTVNIKEKFGENNYDYHGYTLTKVEDTFPTETDDFAPYNNQNNG